MRKSPSDAAIGVATLSGLIWKCLQIKITANMKVERSRLATFAVTTLAVMRRMISFLVSMSFSSGLMYEISSAIRGARKPTVEL